VGRGGEKLDAALEQFAVDVTGAVALDAGASTGGFTDCLLRHGASVVAALDVGHGQLDARLRADERVVVLERTTAAVPVLAGPIALPGAPLVLLVKPQFEVGRAEASRGRGVVREPGLWLGSLRAVASSLAAAGAAIMDVMRSPITGASGNTEFFVHAVAHRGADGAAVPEDADQRLRDAVSTATG